MILDDIKEIINETFKINKEIIELETPLYNGGLNLNSIQLLELTVSIEEYYEKEFNPDDLTEGNFSNVEKLCQLIEEKLL